MTSTEKRGQKRPWTDHSSDAASCWICLEEGPRKGSGDPLVRDCSCRGHSGFAHLSCIVKYASTNAISNFDRHDVEKISEPWVFCPNCHQEYTNTLADDLSTSCMAFVANRLMMKMTALQSVASHAGPKQRQSAEEAKRIANKLLLTIEKMKLVEPPINLMRKVSHIEIAAYNCLGMLAVEAGNRLSAKIAVGYFEKSRNISEESYADLRMTSAKSKFEGHSTDTHKEDEMRYHRDLYKQCVKQFGEEAPTTIKAGIGLADALVRVAYEIEAQRLLTKLDAICRRVHAPDHTLTSSVSARLQKVKTRYVFIRSQLGQYGLKYFQALRYEENGESCVIQGPVETPRIINEEETHTVIADDIMLTPGMPVVCHDTLNHPHERVGYLGVWDKRSHCFQVHFEDKCLGTCLVEQEFIRLLLELPDESSDAEKNNN